MQKAFSHTYFHSGISRWWSGPLDLKYSQKHNRFSCHSQAAIFEFCTSPVYHRSFIATVTRASYWISIFMALIIVQHPFAIYGTLSFPESPLIGWANLNWLFAIHKNWGSQFQILWLDYFLLPFLLATMFHLTFIFRPLQECADFYDLHEHTLVQNT